MTLAVRKLLSTCLKCSQTNRYLPLRPALLSRHLRCAVSCVAQVNRITDDRGELVALSYGAPLHCIVGASHSTPHCIVVVACSTTSLVLLSNPHCIVVVAYTTTSLVPLTVLPTALLLLHAPLHCCTATDHFVVVVVVRIY